MKYFLIFSLILINFIYCKTFLIETNSNEDEKNYDSDDGQEFERGFRGMTFH